MRSVLVALFFSVVAFGGCVTNTPTPEIPESAQSDDDGVPQGAFEPVVSFIPSSTWVSAGATVEFTFSVSDLDDYPFPLDFIDWNLTYSREANPVLEGDAYQLPGNYSRTLFAEDFHVFKFHVEDGQGFDVIKNLIIKVGEPTRTVEQAIEDEGLSEGVEVYTFDGSVARICDGNGPGPGAGCTAEASECDGWNNNVNMDDCWWFPVDENMWRGDFEIITENEDPDTFFYANCDHPHAENADNPPVAPERTGVEFGTVGVIPDWTNCIVTFEWGDETIFGGSPGPMTFIITMNVEPDFDPWVERDDEGVCHATYGVIEGGDSGEEDVGAEYIHDRDTEPVGAPSPSGGGSGIWEFEESNGIPGLQVGGSGPLADDQEVYTECVNPDFIVI